MYLCIYRTTKVQKLRRWKTGIQYRYVVCSINIIPTAIRKAATANAPILSYPIQSLRLYTAKNVVKKVFPTSKIIENRIDSYPIQVIVTATAQQHGGNSNNRDGDASVELELWRGRQQDLFSKYKQKRNNAINKIQASLEEYKITCATTTTPPTES